MKLTVGDEFERFVIISRIGDENTFAMRVYYDNNSAFCIVRLFTGREIRSWSHLMGPSTEIIFRSNKIT